MKKLSIAIALLLSAALVLIGAPMASAAGSDDPTPYTVSEEGITLPVGVTFPDNGHVNVKSNQGPQGIHFESQNWPADHPKKKYIGQSFIPWSAFGYDTATLCVTWVQISMYNEHFGEGGQKPVGKGCAPTPPPFDGVTKYTPTYAVTCEGLTFSHPAFKSAFGIANIYGVRYGINQADAQSKPFDVYVPNSVVTYTFADKYVANTFYFEFKVGYDGQNLTHQIGQTRGTSDACTRPIPEKPLPITGTEVKDLAPVCEIPANGKAIVVTETRDWLEDFVFNTVTWTWDKKDRVYDKWAETSRTTVTLAACDAPPVPEIPTKPTTTELAVTGSESQTPNLIMVGIALILAGSGIIIGGLALIPSRVKRRS